MDMLQTHLLGSLEEFKAFARKHLSDPELAADAIQESLLKAVKASEGIDELGDAKAWFYRILRRTIIDLYRRRDARARALERMERELAVPATAEEERAACACLGKLLPTLKPEYSALIRRLDLEGESSEQVASNLGLTANNLKVRLHRARKQLRERLITTCGICATHGCLDCTCRAASERNC